LCAALRLVGRGPEATAPYLQGQRILVPPTFAPDQGAPEDASEEPIRTVSHILCGDFNSTPESALVSFLRTGRFNLAEHTDRKSVDGQYDENFRSHYPGQLLLI
jgi:endonuclease/exonuclease/phosphatase family metal-dependent hydrolase